MHIPLGYTSPARHLAHQAQISNELAETLARVTRFVTTNELTAKALYTGALTVNHVDVLARNATGLSHAYTEQETELIALAERGDLAHFEKAVRTWRWATNPATAKQDTETAYQQRRLTVKPDLFGGCQGRFQLDPTAAETFLAAIDTQPDPLDGPEPARSLAQRQADALTEIAAQATNTQPTNEPARNSNSASGQANQSNPGSGQGGSGRAASARNTECEWSSQPHGRAVTAVSADVIIDIATLTGQPNHNPASIRCELSRTGAIPLAVAEQLLCDATFRRVIMDGPNQILNTGRPTPDIPLGLRKAIQTRDQTCRFAGCTAPWSWCDVHHLTPRNKGGITAEHNLGLACRWHHTLIHQAGYNLHRQPDGTFLTTVPDVETDAWALNHKGKWVKQHPQTTHPPN